MLPLTLVGGQSIATAALLDSGAAINVLPFSLGVQLGFDWNRETVTVELSGNLSQVEARIVVVEVIVAEFPAVRQGFAWAQTEGIPVIFGQVNVFMEFDVCFFRSRGFFELRPKQ